MKPKEEGSQDRALGDLAARMKCDTDQGSPGGSVRLQGEEASPLQGGVTPHSPSSQRPGPGFCFNTSLRGEPVQNPEDVRLNAGHSSVFSSDWNVPV
ncbi:hypothetical protein EYF80_059006 [Liparis tanakae]|uniref:Uncharacterized protein n=1 Tax=Liparis tanakae TaxID=230148 RepID=A0A4Z2ERB8_9TELE|nr:hypothetical protein EYF80_059006 [Liparis tanakae]